TLVDGADVFVSNARPSALARAGLDHASVSARNPRLVYAHVSGYGLNGEEADRAAYDVGAFWSRAGVAAALTPDGAPLPYQRGGMGDHMAGMAAAGGGGGRPAGAGGDGGGGTRGDPLCRGRVVLRGLVIAI